MRQSTQKYLLMAGVSIVTVGAAMLLGMDAAHAKTFADSFSGTYTTQIGAVAQTIKQATIPLGAAMTAGGAYKGYKDLKGGEVEKKGAGLLLTDAALMGMGGLVIYAGALINKGAATADLQDAPIDKTTGGQIGW